MYARVCKHVCLYKHMYMSVCMYMYGMHLYMCKYEYVCACMHIFLIQQKSQTSKGSSDPSEELDRFLGLCFCCSWNW